MLRFLGNINGLSNTKWVQDVYFFKDTCYGICKSTIRLNILSLPLPCYPNRILKSCSWQKKPCTLLNALPESFLRHLFCHQIYNTMGQEMWRILHQKDSLLRHPKATCCFCGIDKLNQSEASSLVFILQYWGRFGSLGESLKFIGPLIASMWIRCFPFVQRISTLSFLALWDIL